MTGPRRVLRLRIDHVSLDVATTGGGSRAALTAELQDAVHRQLEVLLTGPAGSAGPLGDGVPRELRRLRVTADGGSVADVGRAVADAVGQAVGAPAPSRPGGTR